MMGKQFEDRFEIRELQERYFMAGDLRDAEMLVGCFARDGKMSVSLADGRAVLDRSRIAEGPRNLMSGLRNSIHALSSSVVELEGDRGTGTVLAVSYLSIGEKIGGKMLVRGIRYDDAYIREDDRWLFKERYHSVLWQYEEETVAQGFASKGALSSASA